MTKHYDARISFSSSEHPHFPNRVMEPCEIEDTDEARQAYIDATVARYKQQHGSEHVLVALRESATELPG